MLEAKHVTMIVENVWNVHFEIITNLYECDYGTSEASVDIHTSFILHPLGIYID